MKPTNHYTIKYSTNHCSFIYVPSHSHLFPECEGCCTFTHDVDADDDDDDDGTS